MTKPATLRHIVLAGGLLVLSVTAIAQARKVAAPPDPAVLFKKHCQTLSTVVGPVKIEALTEEWMACYSEVTAVARGKTITMKPGALIAVTLSVGEDSSHSREALRGLPFTDEITVNGIPGTVGGYNIGRVVYGIVTWKHGARTMNVSLTVLCTGMTITGHDCFVTQNDQPTDLTPQTFSIARKNALEYAEKLDLAMGYPKFQGQR